MYVTFCVAVGIVIHMPIQSNERMILLMIVMLPIIHPAKNTR